MRRTGREMKEEEVEFKKPTQREREMFLLPLVTEIRGKYCPV